MRSLAILVCAGFSLAACASSGADEQPLDRAADAGAAAADAAADRDDTAASSSAATDPPTTTTTTPSPTTPRPEWLGTRVLPTAASGFGEIQPTPPELADRRFATIDVLPPPTSDTFAPSVTAVPGDVVARSTWTDACPVSVDDLRYVTVPFWGFDGLLHTGELLVHADAVDAMVNGFSHLFDRRFPIESMQITTKAELDAPMTGDGNNTSAFVCRPTRGSTAWSEHAYGRGIDINPFHNPYVKGDVVLPELASVYVDRADQRPGMLTADDVAGFTSTGWGWGGAWGSFKDYMHLSADGS